MTAMAGLITNNLMEKTFRANEIFISASKNLTHKIYKNIYKIMKRHKITSRSF